MTVDSEKFFRRSVPILIGLLLLARVLAMAFLPLMDTTEARYGEIARKMAELGDWITPWFDYGVPYWGKPPLAFWLTAISFELFGVSEFAARLPHFIVSIIIVALVWWLSAIRDRDAAMPTVAVICAAFFYFVPAAAVTPDVELTLGASLAMAGLWLAVQETDAGPGASRWFASLLFFGGLVVGLLAKGPIVMVLVGMPLFLWATYSRRWLEVWRRLLWVRGTLGTLAIVLPWYWLAEQRTPGFLSYFLVGEHWHRFVTPGWPGDRYGHAHTFPIGTIWALAFVDILPWSVVLPIAAWRWHKHKKRLSAAIVSDVSSSRPDDDLWRSYLLIWAITPVLIFTAARNITMTYVLPGMPAAAMLAGSWLAQQRRLGNAVDQVLSGDMLITLLLVTRLAMHEGRSYIERKSVKELVAVYDQTKKIHDSSLTAAPSDQQSDQPNSPLIFVGVRPYSAQFYSRGRTIKVDSIDQCWQRIGAGSAYVAIPSVAGDAFRGSGAARTETSKTEGIVAKPPHRVSRLYRRAGFDLYYVTP